VLLHVSLHVYTHSHSHFLHFICSPELFIKVSYAVPLFLSFTHLIVYRSFVSFWPAKNVVELADRPTLYVGLQDHVICCLC